MTVPTGPLPGELADPLRFPDAPSGAWLPLLLLLALWLLARWLSRRRARSQPKPAPQATAVPAPRGSAVEAIEAVRRHHLAHETYREGCHELAALLRRHLEGGGTGTDEAVPWTRLTALEIAQRVGDRPAARLFSRLAGLRFGRAEPERQEFEHACGEASTLVRSARG